MRDWVSEHPLVLLNASPFFFFFRPSAWLTPTSLSSKDRFNTSDLRLSNSNLSLPFFVSSSPYLSESLLHTSALSPVLLLSYLSRFQNSSFNWIKKTAYLKKSSELPTECGWFTSGISPLFMFRLGVFLLNDLLRLMGLEPYSGFC